MSKQLREFWHTIDGKSFKAIEYSALVNQELRHAKNLEKMLAEHRKLEAKAEKLAAALENSGIELSKIAKPTEDFVKENQGSSYYLPNGYYLIQKVRKEIEQTLAEYRGNK